jgi:hypothetical protein
MFIHVRTSKHITCHTFVVVVVVNIVVDDVVNIVVVDVVNIVVVDVVNIVVDDVLKHYFSNHVFRVESPDELVFLT